MKRISIIMMCFAALAFVSCSNLSSLAGSDSAAKASGKSTATALLGLYNSYKTTGTINLGNAADLTNALVVANAYTSLRSNKGNEAYNKSFASGMVSAGTGLINLGNVDSIIGMMNNLTGLGVNAANISNSVGTATAIIQLLQALGTAPAAN